MHILAYLRHEARRILREVRAIEGPLCLQLRLRVAGLLQHMSIGLVVDSGGQLRRSTSAVNSVPTLALFLRPQWR